MNNIEKYKNIIDRYSNLEHRIKNVQGSISLLKRDKYRKLTMGSLNKEEWYSEREYDLNVCDMSCWRGIVNILIEELELDIKEMKREMEKINEKISIKE